MREHLPEGLRPQSPAHSRLLRSVVVGAAPASATSTWGMRRVPVPCVHLQPVQWQMGWPSDTCGSSSKHGTGKSAEETGSRGGLQPFWDERCRTSLAGGPDAGCSQAGTGRRPVWGPVPGGSLAPICHQAVLFLGVQHSSQRGGAPTPSLRAPRPVHVLGDTKTSLKRRVP